MNTSGKEETTLWHLWKLMWFIAHLLLPFWLVVRYCSLLKNVVHSMLWLYYAFFVLWITPEIQFWRELTTEDGRHNVVLLKSSWKYLFHTFTFAGIVKLTFWEKKCITTALCLFYIVNYSRKSVLKGTDH